MATTQILFKNSGYDFSQYITALTHESAKKSDNKLTLTLHCPVRIVDRLNENDIYTFRYGWVKGSMSRMRKAKLQQIDINQVSLKSCKINITASDLGFDLKQHHSDTIYDDLTASQIVYKIAQKHNFLIRNIDTTKRVYDEILQNNRSDFEVCQELATKENMTFYVDDDEFIFIKEDYNKASKRTFTLDDLLSLRISYKKDKTNSAKIKTVTRTVNPDNGEVIEEEVTNSSQTNKAKLNRATPAFIGRGADGSEIKKVIDLPTGKTREEVKNQGNRTKEKAEKNPIKVYISVRGTASLRTDDVVTLFIPTKKYSGNYKILKFRNALTMSTFTSSFTLETNALREGGEKAEQVNNSQGAKTEQKTSKAFRGIASDGSEI